MTVPSDRGRTVEILYVRDEAPYRLDSLLAVLQNLRDLVAVVSGAVEDEYRDAPALAQLARTDPVPPQSALSRAGWWVASDLELISLAYHDRLRLTFAESTKLLALRPVWEDWASARPPVQAHLGSADRDPRRAAATLLGQHLRSSHQTLLLRAIEERKESALLRAAAALTAIDVVHWGS